MTAVRRTLVYVANDLTSQDFTTEAGIPFDGVAEDTLHMFNASYSTTKLVVPTGVTKLRLTGSAYMTGVGNNNTAFLELFVNDAKHLTAVGTVSPVAQSVSDTNTERYLLFEAPSFPVSPGDEIEMSYLQQTDTSVTIKANYTWFLIEDVL